MLQAYVRSSQCMRNHLLLKAMQACPEQFNVARQRHLWTRHVVNFSNCGSPKTENKYSTPNRTLLSNLNQSNIVSLKACQLNDAHTFALCKRHLSTTKCTYKKENDGLTEGANGVTRKVHADNSEWETVYRFKHIRQARIIQKLKIYQTGFTCFLALPGSLGLYIYDAIPAEAVTFVLASSLLACGMLYLMGQFCARLIGILYVSKNDNTLVKIAHLNFWGRREDQIVTKTDIIPFSELPDNISDIYVNLGFYSDREKKLHMCIRYGNIYNKEEFEDIFGNFSGLNIVKKKD